MKLGPQFLDPQYVATARTALEFWQFNASDLTDEQAVRLFHQEEVRRWKAIGTAAKACGKSMGDLARALKRFHRASVKSLKPFPTLTVRS